jgi:SAM-dependent methyltransferase
VVLNSIPDGCERGLDVGCGLGQLTRRLRLYVPDVTGIDKDHQSIEHARGHPDAGDITYVHGDFLDSGFPPQSFDLVTSMASLRHMNATAALERMRDLLRPGGVLAMVGLARESSALDVALTVPAAIGARLHQAIDVRADTERKLDSYSAPVCWPPPVSYRAMRALARRLLPGARYQGTCSGGTPSSGASRHDRVSTPRRWNGPHGFARLAVGSHGGPGRTASWIDSHRLGEHRVYVQGTVDRE